VSKPKRKRESRGLAGGTVIFKHTPAVRDPKTGQLVKGKEETAAFPVLTTIQLQHYRTFDARKGLLMRDRYQVPRQLMSLITGGHADTYSRFLQESYAVRQGVIHQVPQVETFEDPDYLAFFEWWKHIIATGDRKTIDDFSTWAWDLTKVYSVRSWSWVEAMGYTQRELHKKEARIRANV
jgi:hypothetical protein